MDVDALASRAVEAYRRGLGGSQARLVERKLRRSRAGVRALQALRDGTPDEPMHEVARDVLADELARDRRRVVIGLAIGLLAVCVTAGLGVYQLTRPEPPEAPPAPVA